MDLVINFFRSKTAPSILLIVATILAFIFANTNLASYYDVFKNLPVVFKAGDFGIEKPLLLWINDGLMAIFFLLIGMEMKREIIGGHLSNFKNVILPLIAAVGGMIVPAGIYAFLHWDSPNTLLGWAIPAATDIAFALGILYMLGSRVPASLKVCLVAIAVLDDLMAVIIIALFYTNDISTSALTMASIGLFLALVLNFLKVSSLSLYGILGIFIWAWVIKSGVHATLAGVILGFIIPLRLKNADGKSPLKVFEHALQPWVTFLIVPLFAFVNSGVSFSGFSAASLLHPITFAVAIALFFGKQIGIFLFSYVAVSLNICSLPQGSSWAQYYGLCLLCGIGFTMSLFIGTLAFPDSDYLEATRVGVLLGSGLSALVGVLVLIVSAKQAR